MFQRLYKGISFYSNLYILKRVPVIIFAPGHVGSMALHHDLAAADIFVFKVEFFNKYGIRTSRFIARHFFRKKRPAKIITIVRDPIAQMAAYFFSKSAAGHLPRAHKAWKEHDIATLNDCFISDVLLTNRLDSHLYWFERDFFDATGINVFESEFDTQTGSGIINHKIFPTLIIRTETGENIKTERIKKFLHLRSFSVTRNNTRAQKTDHKLYEDFKNQMKIPLEIFDKVYGSPLANHFLTKAEIDTARTRYVSL